MKSFLILVMLFMGMNVMAQTEIRISTEMDLSSCNIEILDNNQNYVPMNDMRVWSTTEISVFLDAGQHYTLLIDKTYKIDIFPVPNSEATVFAYLAYKDMHDGWLNIDEDNPTFLALKSKSAGYDKKLQREQRRAQKQLCRGRY